MDNMSFLDTRTAANVIAAIRKSFLYSLQYKMIIDRAKTNEVGPRGGSRHTCASCKLSFDRRTIIVDHIDPIVPLHLHWSEMSLKMIYERCFCLDLNLQVLCKNCHKVKTAKENSKRKEFRKGKLIKPKFVKVS